MNIKNLKQFNLEEALSGKAVMLRDGRKAYVRHHETDLDVEPECDVESMDMGNDFSLAVLKENDEIIEVSIAYKDVCVGVELTLEEAKERINSITPEDIDYLEQLVDDFKSVYF